MNSHSESIAKIEAHEEEPSPIYWPLEQQSQQEQYTAQFFAEIEAKMDAHEKEPYPIYWLPQQSQAEPPPPVIYNFQDQMMKFMNKMDQIRESQTHILKPYQEKYTPQFFVKMDAHFEQIMNHLNRKEEKLQR